MASRQVDGAQVPRGWRRPLLAAAFVLLAGDVRAQLDFEAEPINYDTAVADDPVARLQRRIEAGEVRLDYESEHGYLSSVLEQLRVPTSSQVLVFSKTSFQLRRISPQRPRAVYFNDDVYVGWVQGGDVVEVSAVDPHLGAVFYTLRQQPQPQPRFLRDRGQCITCHASSRTAGVPGHLVRSVFTDPTGQPYFGSGTFNTDDRSPFHERWGGWYVTGTHGLQRHMGNEVVRDEDQPERLDVEHGANVTNLTERVETSPYLSPHSDIVALMVLQHQARMHNLITRLAFETRIALHYDRIMNEAMGRPLDYRSDSTQRRIAAAGDKMIEGLLFVDAFHWQDAVAGTSRFAADFTALGPRDDQGRSLRDLDLSTRLLKHPCSYLIYSAAFDQLPAPALEYAYERLFEVLTGTNHDERFARLSEQDRRAILEILRATKADLPDYWRS